jgi:hypothetical protein
MPNVNTEVLTGIILAPVDDQQTCWFEVETGDDEKVRVYIGAYERELIEPINQLVGEKVDLEIRPVSWKIDIKSGVKNFLISIKS